MVNIPKKLKPIIKRVFQQYLISIRLQRLPQSSYVSAIGIAAVHPYSIISI